MGIICAGATDIGLKRKTNQDSICLDFENHFFAVADGMGGHNGGDTASQLAIEVMKGYFQERPDKSPQDLMLEIINEVNKAIFKKAQENPDLQGMGTTISAILFDGPQLIISNVGDSRVYLFNSHNLFQLTRDHSIVQEKLNLGFYSREDAMHDPQKNVLVRSVGFEESLEIDVFQYRVSKNDIFLVCSDGLHGKVSDADILHIVEKNIPDSSCCNKNNVEAAVKDLIQQANHNGGQDNISVILAVAQS